MRRLLTLLLLMALSLIAKAEGKITLTTQKELHSGYWSIALTAEDAKKGDIWIDWNNNGVKDDGEADIDYRWGNTSEIVVPTVTIYGELKMLKVSNMDLSAIDIASASLLEEIDLRSNKLTSVDFTQAPKLQKITLNQNRSLQRISLAPETMSVLRELSAVMCDLQALDLSTATALTTLKLNENKNLQSLDLRQSTKLETVDLSKCKLQQLSFGSHPALSILYCHDNELSRLDVSGASALEELWCLNNALTEIKLPTTTTLYEVKCYNNKLSGDRMSKVVASLASRSTGEAKLFAINIEVGAPEENVIWKEDVSIAQSKGWQVLARKNRYEDIPYEGSEKVTKPEDRYTTDLPKITLKREQLATKWTIQVTAQPANDNALWADLNGNNRYDEGEALTSMVAKRGLQATVAELNLYGLFETLDCSDNALSEISIGEGACLTELYCQKNQLTELNLQNAPIIKRVHCYSNNIVAPKVSVFISSLPFLGDEETKGELVALDLSEASEGNVFLKDEVAQAKDNGWLVYAIQDDGSTSPYPGKDVNAGQVTYSTAGNTLTLVKKSGATKPWSIFLIPKEKVEKGVWIDANGDKVCQEEERVTDFESTIALDASISKLVVYGDFVGIKCSKSEIVSIDLSKHQELVELHCDDNDISSLDLSRADALAVLECSENKITAIDLSSCSALKMVYLSYNPLNSIKWPTDNNIVVLTMANCTGYLSPELDLTAFAKLEEIKCNGNKLTKLLLPKGDKMSLIACYDNKLTELDLQGMPRLDIFICDQNRLTTIDISTNSALEYISLYSNRIGEEEMAQIFDQLPDRTRAERASEIFVIDSEDFGEENFCRAEWVARARDIKWVVYDNKGRRNNGRNIYEGYSDMEDLFRGEVWNGTRESWSKGSGTEADPYLIESPKHLAYLQQEVTGGKTFEGVYFRQTRDLNMGARELGKKKGNFRPIGIFDAGYVTDPSTGEQTYQDDSKRFNGHYDGHNHFIMNLYQSYNNNAQKTVGGHGLFGCIGVKGEVSNLYLTRSCLFEGDFEGGTIAAYLEGKMTNCGSDATVRGTSIIGGLVAVLSGGEISKSYFSGLASGSMNVGGLVGYMGAPEEDSEKGSTPSIVDAYVRANVQSSSSYVGAAIGLIADKPTLKNIYATGAITGDALSFMQGAFAGALDGKVLADKDKLDITNCYYDKTRIKVEKATSDGEIRGVEAVTEASLKEPAFLGKLGNSFAEDKNEVNHGYPILKQPDFTALDKVIRGDAEELDYYVDGLTITIDKGAEELVVVYSLSGETLLESYSNRVILATRGVYLVKVEDRKALIFL